MHCLRKDNFLEKEYKKDDVDEVVVAESVEEFRMPALSFSSLNNMDSMRTAQTPDNGSQFFIRKGSCAGMLVPFFEVS